MDSKKLIEEIELYLSLYPCDFFGNDHRSSLHPAATKPIIDKMGVSCFSVSSEFNDMLYDILTHCDSETLDELVDIYGDESPIAKMIRKKSMASQAKVTCQLDTMKKALEAQLDNTMHKDNPFYKALCLHLDRLGYKSDAEFYNKIGMPRQQFSRLRDAGNNLSKKAVLWIVVGLRLDYSQACDLLQKAGYHFRKNDCQRQ